MLSEIRIAKDFFIMFISSWLLVLIAVYSWKEEITHKKLLILFLWSIIAWYLALWPIEYLFPKSFNNDKLHDFMVGLTTLSAFQLWVIAYKKDLLLKIYNNKVKKYD